jgi:FKBP-type peptidyl-prolyl cis-trans isomerase 2
MKSKKIVAIARGIILLKETEGHGTPAVKGNKVVFNMKIWLNRGEEVLVNETQAPHLPRHLTRTVNGVTFVDRTITLGRREAIAGVDRGLISMKAGGYRRIRVSPHLAYRNVGVLELIPENAVLEVELWLLEILTA